MSAAIPYLALAIDYLQTSSIPMDDIAFLVGFTEYSNFRKAFKRWTGYPPSHYRAEKQTPSFIIWTLH